MNLMDQIEAGILPASIDAVLCDRPETLAASRCRARHLDVLEPTDPTTVDAWVISKLKELAPELICLCGYTRLLPIENWMIDRVINIHPSLLPEFGGKGMYGQAVHRAVIAAGHSQSGCTVHLVDEQYDHGPTILQRTCHVDPQDTAETLADRVFAEECLALPEAIRLIASGRIRRQGQDIHAAPPDSTWPDAIVRPAPTS